METVSKQKVPERKGVFVYLYLCICIFVFVYLYLCIYGWNEEGGVEETVSKQKVSERKGEREAAGQYMRYKIVSGVSK